MRQTCSNGRCKVPYLPISLWNLNSEQACPSLKSESSVQQLLLNKTELQGMLGDHEWSGPSFKLLLTCVHGLGPIVGTERAGVHNKDRLECKKVDVCSRKAPEVCWAVQWLVCWCVRGSKHLTQDNQLHGPMLWEKCATTYAQQHKGGEWFGFSTGFLCSLWLS